MGGQAQAAGLAAARLTWGLLKCWKRRGNGDQRTQQNQGDRISNSDVKITVRINRFLSEQLGRDGGCSWCFRQDEMFSQQFTHSLSHLGRC